MMGYINLDRNPIYIDRLSFFNVIDLFFSYFVVLIIKNYLWLNQLTTEHIIVKLTTVLLEFIIFWMLWY